MSRKGSTEVLQQYIIKDIVLGASQSEMVDKIINDHWQLGISGYCAQAARNLISKCRKILKAEWKNEHKALRETQLSRLLNLYNDSRNNTDRITALNALKEINKVTGLYEPERVNMKVNGSVTIDFSFTDNNKEENDDEQ